MPAHGDCVAGATAYTAPALKTANLAIVFTDIKGFTERTSRQTLEENQRLLQVHHQLLAPLFKAFGGRIVKSIGDAFLVTFESPTQAVLCGMALQDRLWQHNLTATETYRLDVRVAVNVGEVRVESNDVFGEPVNIASRVEAIAEAGEVFFTEAVYLAMNKAEVPSQEVGAYELKGIPGKIRVFRVPRAPYRVEAPAQEPAPTEEQPPFGNIALSRVSGPGFSFAPDLANKAAALGQRSVALRGQAVSAGRQLLQRLAAAFSRLRAPAASPGEGGAAPASLSPQRRQLAVGAGVLAVVLGVAVVFLRGSEAERAIADVAGASPKEQRNEVRRARKLIEQEEDVPERNWLYGRLSEAQGDPGGALRHYASAARGGHGDAEERLVELLEHADCRVRSSAADTVGELKLESARGELEDLAKDGGPGEEAGGVLGLGACSSKGAAQRALERLGKR
jgi:class 3 adenylate cyclase